MKVSDQDLGAWAGLLTFELEWWYDRTWLHARSFKDLVRRSASVDFNAKERLLTASLGDCHKELVS